MYFLYFLTEVRVYVCVCVYIRAHAPNTRGVLESEPRDQYEMSNVRKQRGSGIWSPLKNIEAFTQTVTFTVYLVKAGRMFFFPALQQRIDGA